MKRRYVIEDSPFSLSEITKHLGYVRQWIEGFNAGTGGRGPPHVDALRMAQLVLRSARLASVDRSGEAGETALAGSTEGESAAPEGGDAHA